MIYYTLVPFLFQVATLEHEKKELAEQFEKMRQEVEQLSKKKTKAAHVSNV